VVVPLSSIIGIENKGILYADQDGITHTISLGEAYKGWKKYMVYSATTPKYMGNYSIKNPQDIFLYTDRPITIDFFHASEKDFDKWTSILEKARSLGYDIFDLDGDRYIENHLKRIKEQILLIKIIDPPLPSAEELTKRFFGDI